MRAALINSFGEPTEVLELADVPEPSAPAAGEVLVGVEYAPINMNDLYVIQGAFPVRPSLPSIVGKFTRRYEKPYRSSLPARFRCPLRQPILSSHCMKRFFTSRGAERCSSIFAERPEPKTHE
jgi:hypothetical protein